MGISPSSLDTLRRKSPGAQLNVSLISRGGKSGKSGAVGPSSFFHPAKRQSWREQSAGETLLSAPIWLMCKWGRRKMCAGTQSVKKLFCEASERWKAAAIKKKIPITAKWFPSRCDSLWKNSPTFEFLAWKIIIRPHGRVAEFELLKGGCTLTHNFFAGVRLWD